MEQYNDIAKNPAHYKHFTGVECKEIVYDLPKWAGDAIKYIFRAPHKGKPVEDLRKARECLTSSTDRRRTDVYNIVLNHPEIFEKAQEVVFAEEEDSLLRKALIVLIILAHYVRDEEVQQLIEAIDDEIEHYLSFEDGI